MPEKDTEFKNAVAELRDEVQQHIDESLDEAQADTKEKVEKLNDKLDQYEEVKERVDSLESRLNRPERGSEEEDGEPVEKKMALQYLRNGPPTQDATEHKLATWAKSEGFPEEKATMLSADDTAGGYLRAPAAMADTIIKDQVEISPMRSVARTTTIGTNKWTGPKRTSTPSAEWTNSETSGASESNSEYGKREVPVHPLAADVSISVDNLNDSRFDLEGEIREDVSEQFGFSEGKAFITGTGTGQPEGILNGGITSIANQDSGSTFNREDLIRLSHDLKTRYFRNGTYLFNLTSLRDIRLLTDSNNQFIWQPGLVSGDPNTIDGRPYVLMQDMDDPDSTGGVFPVAYGDWRRAYLIVDREVMEMQRDPFSGDNWEVQFNFRMRVGGGVLQAEAARLLEFTT